MKALQDRTRDSQSQNVAMDLAVCIAIIFEKYPTLCGFSVQPYITLTRDRARARLQHGLYLADVEVSSWSGFRAPPEVCHQIASMLLELLHEQPEALELISHRTFARTLH
jgi:hypothetical protein